MALIECIDCEKSISTLAITCPHCGRPLTEPKEEGSPLLDSVGWITLISFLVATTTTALAYYYIPIIPWWVLSILFFVSGGSFYSGAISNEANEVIARQGKNKDHNLRL